MASWIRATLACLCGADPVDLEYPFKERPTLYHDAYTAEETADRVIHAMMSAEKDGNDLRLSLKNIVDADSWTENVAHWTLKKLEQTLQDTSKLGPVLKKAYETALEVGLAVEGFTTTHPVFCTVIAIGVLVLLAPWALEALGFGELGPIEGMYMPVYKEAQRCLTVGSGSFAARWQAEYGLAVPKGSLFSFIQRLGMTWHH
jgi:hypothetical protein